MRVKIHVIGKEKINPDANYLFVGNHCSNFDPIVTWNAFRKNNIAYISKASNFKIPMLGRIIKKCCYMAIDRENPKNAIRTINLASELLSNEVSVGVYPEGTRNKKDGLLPFHNGVFKIAQKGNKPIAVIAIKGTTNVHNNFPFHKSHIYVEVVDVILVEEIKKCSTAELGERVKIELLESINGGTNE